VPGEERRYALYDEIATGGMASVYFGRFEGPAGFSRVVAIKKLHPQFARDPDFVTMLLDEARMASRIRHPNVVPTLDVIEDGAELLLAMEYVDGEALSRLLEVAREQSEKVPLEVAVAIVAGVLHGLHAAHEAVTSGGEPLELVHRDVSPQNVLVGVDGVARLLDFGVAKAIGRSHVTREGQLRGKLPYMAPEQLRGEAVTRQSDIWGASAVAWEVLTGRRLFDGDTEPRVYGQVASGKIPAPSSLDPAVSKELDRIVLRGLSRAPGLRFATAREMALALEDCVRPATAAEVGVWVRRLAGPVVAERAVRLAAIERELRNGDTAPADVVAPQPTGGAARRWPRVAGVVALGLVALAAWPGKSRRPPELAKGLETSLATVRLPAPAPEPAARPPDAAGATDLPARTPAESAGARKPPSLPKRSPASGSAGHRPGDNCYSLDAAGIWHVRPECL